MLKRDFARSEAFVNAVVDMLDSNNMSLSEIAAATAVRLAVVQRVQREHRPDWVSPFRPSRDGELVAELERLAADGRDRQQIARALGITYKTVSAVAARRGITLTTPARRRAAERAEAIRTDAEQRQAFVDLLRAGAPLKALAEDFRIDEHRASELARELDPEYRSRFRTRSASERARFFALLDEGHTVTAAAEAVGVSKGAASVWASERRGGPVFRKRKTSPEQTHRVRELLAEGHSVSAISRLVDVDRSTVKRIRDSHGGDAAWR